MKQNKEENLRKLLIRNKKQKFEFKLLQNWHFQTDGRREKFFFSKLFILWFLPLMEEKKVIFLAEQKHAFMELLLQISLGSCQLLTSSIFW